MNQVRPNQNFYSIIVQRDNSSAIEPNTDPKATNQYATKDEAIQTNKKLRAKILLGFDCYREAQKMIEERRERREERHNAS